MAKKTLAQDAQRKRNELAQGLEKEGATSIPGTKSQNHISDKSLKNGDANRETYYIDKNLHNQLKITAIQRGGSPSDLVQEAVQSLLKKYGDKR
jgi:hypothetical protein